MSSEKPVVTSEYEEYVVQEPDRVARVLRYGIVFLVIAILSVLLYALVAGVLAPPAPRTRIENSLLQAEAAVKKNPGSGGAWAALAGAQYAEGNEAQAWETLTQARKRVKDRTILYVNLRELDFLMVEGKDKEALKKADQFLKVEAQYQMEEKAKNLSKRINVPTESGSNVDAQRLFVIKGTAQGNLGQWKEAVKSFDSVLELNDLAADVITLRGWAKLRSGDPAGAKLDFERALQFMPDDPSAKSGLAEASGETSATK